MANKAGAVRLIADKLITTAALTLLALCILTAAMYLYGIRPYVVESGSMEPALPVGSTCFINERADFEKLREGDIIAFEKSDSLRMVHRIVRITDEGIETKGDANRVSDGITTVESNFVGRYLFHVAYLGLISTWIRSPKGAAMGLAILAVAIALILSNEGRVKNEASEE